MEVGLEPFFMQKYVLLKAHAFCLESYTLSTSILLILYFDLFYFEKVYDMTGLTWS